MKIEESYIRRLLLRRPPCVESSGLGGLPCQPQGVLPPASDTDRTGIVKDSDVFRALRLLTEIIRIFEYLGVKLAQLIFEALGIHAQLTPLCRPKVWHLPPTEFAADTLDRLASRKPRELRESGLRIEPPRGRKHPRP